MEGNGRECSAISACRRSGGRDAEDGRPAFGGPEDEEEVEEEEEEEEEEGMAPASPDATGAAVEAWKKSVEVEWKRMKRNGSVVARRRPRAPGSDVEWNGWGMEWNGSVWSVWKSPSSATAAPTNQPSLLSSSHAPRARRPSRGPASPRARS